MVHGHVSENGNENDFPFHECAPCFRANVDGRAYVDENGHAHYGRDHDRDLRARASVRCGCEHLIIKMIYNISKMANIIYIYHEKVLGRKY
jgi:hypothetical protein